ncbi:TPA: hypothetical protein ACH3X2_002055 [Trebouxia sp. C0005]|nr:MAG: hypothetical protein FRX49_04526 [Trebouxia sp. A1-2]
MGAKRGPSAYFVFANEQRAATKEELVATVTDGKAPSVADVAKSIGHKWRELGGSGQQAYKDKAALLAADIAAATDDTSADGDSQANCNPETVEADGDVMPGLPLTSVKRIMCTDEDVARVSGDCVKSMAKATEMFLELLASRGYAQAQRHKRSTIKFCDIHLASIADKRLVDMGLKDMFELEALFADARSDSKENLTAAKKTSNVAADTPTARPITDFFKA